MTDQPTRSKHFHKTYKSTRDVLILAGIGVMFLAIGVIGLSGDDADPVVQWGACLLGAGLLGYGFVSWRNRTHVEISERISIKHTTAWSSRSQTIDRDAVASVHLMPMEKSFWDFVGYGFLMFYHDMNWVVLRDKDATALCNVDVRSHDETAAADEIARALDVPGPSTIG